MRQPSFDKVVLRSLFLLCAGGWAFTGTQLPWLLMARNETHAPAVGVGALWAVAWLSWAAFGWPAITLTIVAMFEYGSRKHPERVLLIPLVMVSICIASGAIYAIWSKAERTYRRNARREYIRQKQWEEDAPNRDVRKKAADLRNRQRQTAAPWREQGANVDFDGEKLIAIHFDNRSQCNLKKLKDATFVKELAIVMTPLGDDDIDDLVLASQLERLALVDTGITDAGFARLSQLPELRELNLSEDAVNTKSVVALQIASPQLNVFGVSTIGGPRDQWTRQDWKSARMILGDEDFQKALRDAGLDGIPPDAPEEEIVSEDNSAESQPTEPAGVP